MHDTPPRPPISQRKSSTLIDDLCAALRDVGVFDYELPDGARVVLAINDVRSIKQELDARNIDTTEYLETLSIQTHWLMSDLLRDCLMFPAALPYVKGHDGIRRRLRCGVCLKAEHPSNTQNFLMCNGCLENILESIKTRTPTDQIVLFRTYNAGARCHHADADTVLAQQGYYEIAFGNCERCYREELDRRRTTR